MQTLRDAVLKADYAQVRATVSAMRASGAEEPDGAVFEHLSSAGLILLRDGQSGLAVDVFALMAERFPDHPDGYLHLEEAYRRAGRDDQVAEARRLATEVDPVVVAIATR